MGGVTIVFNTTSGQNLPVFSAVVNMSGLPHAMATSSGEGEYEDDIICHWSRWTLVQVYLEAADAIIDAEQLIEVEST